MTVALLNKIESKYQTKFSRVWDVERKDVCEVMNWTDSVDYIWSEVVLSSEKDTNGKDGDIYNIYNFGRRDRELSKKNWPFDDWFRQLIDSSIIIKISNHIKDISLTVVKFLGVLQKQTFIGVPGVPYAPTLSF